MPYYFNRPLNKGLMKITVDQNLDTVTNAVKFIIQRELAIRGLIPVPDKAMLEEIKKQKSFYATLDVEKLELCNHRRAYRPSRTGYSALVCEQCGNEFMGDDQMEANNMLERSRLKNNPPKVKQVCLDSDPDSHSWDVTNTFCTRCKITSEAFYILYIKSKVHANPLKEAEDDAKAGSDKIEQALANLSYPVEKEKKDEQAETEAEAKGETETEEKK